MKSRLLEALMKNHQSTPQPTEAPSVVNVYDCTENQPGACHLGNAN